jgi:hypothetical protein
MVTREKGTCAGGMRVALWVGMNRLMATLAVGLVLSVTVMWDVARDAIAATTHPHHHRVQTQQTQPLPATPAAHL